MLWFFENNGCVNEVYISHYPVRPSWNLYSSHDSLFSLDMESGLRTFIATIPNNTGGLYEYLGLSKLGSNERVALIKSNTWLWMSWKFWRKPHYLCMKWKIMEKKIIQPSELKKKYDSYDIFNKEIIDINRLKPSNIPIWVASVDKKTSRRQSFFWVTHSFKKN